MQDDRANRAGVGEESPDLLELISRRSCRARGRLQVKSKSGDLLHLFIN